MIKQDAIRAVIDHLEGLHTAAITDARQADAEGARNRELFCDGKSVGLEVALEQLYELLGDK